MIYELPDDARVREYFSAVDYAAPGVDFTKGRFFTIAPDPVSPERLMQLATGGLTTPGQAVVQGEYRLTPVTQLTAEFAEVLADELTRWPNASIVGFDVLGDKPTPKPDLAKHPYGIAAKNTDLVAFINDFSTAWRTVALIVDNATTVAEVAPRVRLFAVSAYDGESFVYWSHA